MNMQDAPLERQLSQLFNAEAASAHMPRDMWQTISPKLGEPAAPFILRRLFNSAPTPHWRNPMYMKHVATVATVVLALIAALVFVVLLNTDGNGNGGPSPATSPTVPVNSTEQRPTPDLEATTEKAFSDATATARAGVTPADSSPVTTPAPTSTVMPQSSPVASSMEVIHSIFGTPSTGTVFEELLTRLPDNESTRYYANLADVAGVAELLGIEMPPPGTEASELDPYFRAWQAASLETGFGVVLPGWPSELRDYISTIDWYPYAGFDMWSVDQYANAGSRPFVADVAIGQFDPNRTASALAACDCDQPDIREHAGVEFMAWGEELVGQLQLRKSPPLYDHIGRGPRLLIRDGEAYWTVRDAVMEGFIETLSGSQPSLGDDDDYTGAVAWLTSLGIIRDMTLASSGLSIAEVVQGNPPLFNDVIEDTPLLKPFELAAVGEGFDGERAFTGIVIGHGDETTASENMSIFEERLRNGRLSSDSDHTWAEDVERLEIGVEGRFMVARIYSLSPHGGGLWVSLSLGNTLLVHE